MNGSTVIFQNQIYSSLVCCCASEQLEDDLRYRIGRRTCVCKVNKISVLPVHVHILHHSLIIILTVSYTLHNLHTLHYINVRRIGFRVHVNQRCIWMHLVCTTVQHVRNVKLCWRREKNSVKQFSSSVAVRMIKTTSMLLGWQEFESFRCVFWLPQIKFHWDEVYVESAADSLSGKGIASSLEIWSAVNSACCFQSRSWYLELENVLAVLANDLVAWCCYHPALLFCRFFMHHIGLPNGVIWKCHQSSSMQTHTHR